jgi:hypothetical protein
MIAIVAAARSLPVPHVSALRERLHLPVGHRWADHGLLLQADNQGVGVQAQAWGR